MIACHDKSESVYSQGGDISFVRTVFFVIFVDFLILYHASIKIGVPVLK